MTNSSTTVDSVDSSYFVTTGNQDDTSEEFKIRKEVQNGIPKLLKVFDVQLNSNIGTKEELLIDLLFAFQELFIDEADKYYLSPEDLNQRWFSLGIIEDDDTEVNIKIGCPGHSGNVAITSNKFQIELIHDGSFMVFDKKRNYSELFVQEKDNAIKEVYEKIKSIKANQSQLVID